MKIILHLPITNTSSIDTVPDDINNNNNNTTAEAGAVSMGTSTSDCCKEANKGASKSNDSTLEVIGQLQNMSTADNNVSICANCGKEGANNICNKCKQVKYCNAACKKKHRSKHKKQCERRIAELHDEKLFKEPPPQLGDCPICFLRLPSLETGYIYQTCCGKVICSGCAYAPVYDDQGNEVDNDKQNECAFCRTLAPKSIKEVVERLKKRVEAEDSFAIHSLGIHYRDGSYGLPQDYNKALELWHRAGELGYAEAYASIGYAYDNGRGLEVDETKAAHYYELAAIRGDEMARHNLGCMEGEAGNTERALKHHMIAVRAGDNDSLKEIQGLYSDGYATKDDYTEALQSYQAYLGEIKSRQRDEAAAADEDHRYY